MLTSCNNEMKKDAEEAAKLECQISKMMGENSLTEGQKKQIMDDANTLKQKIEKEYEADDEVIDKWRSTLMDAKRNTDCKDIN